MTTYLDHQPERIEDLATWPFPQSRKTFAMLREREAPAYEGRATSESTDLLLTYSVSSYLDRLVDKPVKLVVAEGDDHTHWDLALRAFERIPSTRKELTVVPQASHLTMYTDLDTQSRVAAEIGEFFARFLAASQPTSRA